MSDIELYELGCQISDAFYNDEDYRNDIKGIVNEMFVNHNDFEWEYEEWLVLNMFTELKKVYEMKNLLTRRNKTMATMYEIDYNHCMVWLLTNYSEVYFEWDKVPKDGMRKAIEGDEEE